MSSRRAARIRIAVVALLGVEPEERLETLIALGLLGAVGAMIGIAIAVVDL